MTRCKYSIVNVTENVVLISDNGGMVSVTNDAEAVVKELAPMLHSYRRLLYIDSEGQTDEIVHEFGEFVGFRILP